MVTSVRRLALADQPIDLWLSVVQTCRVKIRRLPKPPVWQRFLVVFFCNYRQSGVVFSAVDGWALRRLAASLSVGGPEDLSPVTARVPVEIVPLVKSLKQFTGRLRNFLTRSEDYIAEAAHRVRTLMATWRSQAEITLQKVNKDENRASLKEMVRANDDTSRAAGQLLDHEMVTFRTDHLQQSQIDRTQLVAETVDHLRVVAELKEISLNLAKSGPTPVLGDAILIQKAGRTLFKTVLNTRRWTVK